MDPETLTSYKRQKDLSRLVARLKIPVEDGHYVHVYIWADRQSMYDNVNAEPPYWGYYSALAYKIDVDTGLPLMKPKVAEIHLVSGGFGIGIWAHEATHMLMDWVGRLDIDFANQEFERPSEIMYRMTKSFWAQVSQTCPQVLADYHGEQIVI
jgi:hypothetical protein